MFSIVVPAYNNATTIAAQLTALRQQDCEHEWEVVVIDNASTDETANILEKWTDSWPRMKSVFHDATRGVSAARNAGARLARGDVVLFCDADDSVESGWLRAHAEAFEAGAFLTGGILVRDDGVVSGVVTSLWSLGFPSGANCGVRRTVFDTVGLFDESFPFGGDETEFFWRAQVAGYPLVEVERARVRYSSRPTARGEITQRFKYGRSNARLYKMFKSQGMPRRSLAQGLLSHTVSLLRVAYSPLQSRERRRRAIGVASLHAGRVVGSIRHKVIYL